MAIGPTPWVTKVDPPADGEEVKSAIISRSIQQLAQRTQHLKELMDLLEAGETLFLQSVALTAEVQIGFAVYYDDNVQAYAPALAAVEESTEGNYYVAAKSAYVAGIVVAKTGTASGTLVTVGKLAGLDWTNSIGSLTGTPGPYYLSGIEAGKLTQQKPAVSVYVLYMRDQGEAQVIPVPKDFLESHIHYRFELNAVPAGVAACMTYGDGQAHEILDADVDAQGWLPADNAVFNSTAPAGAIFGYNLSQHPELERVLPPIPVSSSYLEVNGVGIPLGVTGRAIIDTYGIWWMDDCYGYGPWPPGFSPCGLSSSSSSSSLSSSSSSSSSISSSSSSSSVSSSSSSDSSSSSSSSAIQCPAPPLEYLPGHGATRLDEMTIVLWFTKMVFKTNESVVTTLAPAESSPITVTDCDGDTANTGDLQLDIDLDFQAGAQTEAGHIVHKTIEGLTIKSGPVVEAVKSGNQYVTVTSTAEEAETGRHQGDITIAFNDPRSAETYGAVDLFALDNVAERKYEDIFYLEFPAGRAAAIRGKLDLPEFLPENPQLNLVFWLLTRADGSVPNLGISYRRISAPTEDVCSGAIDLPLSAAEVTLTDIIPACAPGANKIIAVTTDLFDVAINEVIYFTLSRAGDTDAYAGDLGLLRSRYKVTST